MQHDPYLGGDSVSGLALGLGGPSIRLPVCVCVGGGDVEGGASTRKRALQGARAGREGRARAT